MAEGRVGVEQIGDFYEKYTGYRQAPDSIKWVEIEELQTATVTNGVVFRDEEDLRTSGTVCKSTGRSRFIKLARNFVHGSRPASVIMEGRWLEGTTVPRKYVFRIHAAYNEMSVHSQQKVCAVLQVDVSGN